MASEKTEGMFGSVDQACAQVQAFLARMLHEVDDVRTNGFDLNGTNTIDCKAGDLTITGTVTSKLHIAFSPGV